MYTTLNYLVINIMIVINVFIIKIEPFHFVCGLSHGSTKEVVSLGRIRKVVNSKPW